MTFRELRKILTEVYNQELTVKELRALLFEVEDQDSEITFNRLYELTNKSEALKMALRKIPNDTDTFKFHNENPKNNRTSDCVVRAIATATGKAWDEVLDDLVTIAHKLKVMPNDTKCYAKYLESLGFEKMKQPRHADNTKYTGSEFCEYLNARVPKGTQIVAHIGGHHTVAIAYDKGYRVIDTWNSTGGTIGNYWIKW